MAIEDIGRVEAELFEYLTATHDATLASIRESGVLSDETAQQLREAIAHCKEKFV